MSHEAYAPVGYAYRADNYCLDCIVKLTIGGKPPIAYAGRKGACKCTECRLDRLAKLLGIDRYDEWSFDSDYFPKHIPYHNDLHCECGPEGYGYGPEDPEWQQQYCNATCARCHEVIDGVSKLDGPDVCPVFDNREVPA